MDFKSITVSLQGTTAHLRFVRPEDHRPAPTGHEPAAVHLVHAHCQQRRTAVTISVPGNNCKPLTLGLPDNSEGQCRDLPMHAGGVAGRWTGARAFAAKILTSTATSGSYGCRWDGLDDYW
jgi:hypothetical protein